jgi:hypothetical protein
VSKRILGPLVLLVSLFLCFLVAEVALRVLSKSSLHVFDVEMWRYAKLIKLESTHPGVVEEHRPNAEALLMGVDVKTDEHGFRLPGDDLLQVRRPDDRVVMAVGDSVTFGWGVPGSDTWPGQLERRLNALCPKEGGRRATVHNSGIGNCNLSMELARYKIQGRPMKPEWVIFGYSYNDAEPDPVPSSNPFLWRSSLIALTTARIQKQFALADYDTYYHSLYKDGQPGWARFEQSLRELGALLRQDGVGGTLLLLPELHFPKGFGNFKDIYAKVTRIGEESGFEVIDPSGAFPEGPGERFWVSPEDAHPTAEAQGFYADALAKSRYACGKPTAPAEPAEPAVAPAP